MSDYLYMSLNTNVETIYWNFLNDSLNEAVVIEKLYLIITEICTRDTKKAYFLNIFNPLQKKKKKKKKKYTTMNFNFTKNLIVKFIFISYCNVNF